MARDELGIGFTGAPYDVREVVELAKLAEKEGFSGFWFAEDLWHEGRDTGQGRRVSGSRRHRANLAPHGDQRSELIRSVA